MGGRLGKKSKSKSKELQPKNEEVVEVDEPVVSSHHDGGLQGYKDKEGMDKMREIMAKKKLENQQEKEAREKRLQEAASASGESGDQE